MGQITVKCYLVGIKKIKELQEVDFHRKYSPMGIDFRHPPEIVS